MDKLSYTTVPCRTVSDYADTDAGGVGFLDQKLPWRAAGPSSPVSPQPQWRGLFLHGLAGLCILAHARLYQVTWWESGLPFPPSQGHVTQDFWTDLSAVVMAHLVPAVGHVDDGQKLPRMFLESSWPGGHPISWQGYPTRSEILVHLTSPWSYCNGQSMEEGEGDSLPFGGSHPCCFAGQELSRWQDSLRTQPQRQKILFVHWKKSFKQHHRYLKFPALLLFNFSLTGALKFVQKSAFRFLSTLF